MAVLADLEKKHFRIATSGLIILALAIALFTYYQNTVNSNDAQQITNMTMTPILGGTTAWLTANMLTDDATISLEARRAKERADKLEHDKVNRKDLSGFFNDIAQKLQPPKKSK